MAGADPGLRRGDDLSLHSSKLGNIVGAHICTHSYFKLGIMFMIMKLSGRKYAPLHPL